MNKNKLKYSLLIAATALAITALPSSLFAAYTAYSVVFTGSYDATTRWISPIEDNNDVTYYPTITSKWNEPRSIGTSPHVGVDLSTSTYKRVVAVTKGNISHLNDDYNTEVLTPNPAVSNLYVHYEHMVVTTSYPDALYQAGDRIGTAGSTGADAVHLHFGAYDTNSLSTRKAYRNETFYRDAASWNYGRNTDIFSQVQWLQTKKAQMTIVYSGPNNTHDELPLATNMYYRTVGSVAWISGGAMTRVGTTFNYTYDFTSKVPSGTSIQWMVRIKRDTTAANPYSWSPAKFYNPSSDPNSTSNAYAYYTNTVTY